MVGYTMGFMSITAEVRCISSDFAIYTLFLIGIVILTLGQLCIVQTLAFWAERVDVTLVELCADLELVMITGDL